MKKREKLERLSRTGSYAAGVSTSPRALDDKGAAVQRATKRRDAHAPCPTFPVFLRNRLCGTTRAPRRVNLHLHPDTIPPRFFYRPEIAVVIFFNARDIYNQPTTRPKTLLSTQFFTLKNQDFDFIKKFKSIRLRIWKDRILLFNLLYKWNFQAIRGSLKDSNPQKQNDPIWSKMNFQIFRLHGSLNSRFWARVSVIVLRSIFSIIFFINKKNIQLLSKQLSTAKL